MCVAGCYFSVIILHGAGFVNGVPREATVSRFRARMGCDFDGAFDVLVKYVVEMTEVEKVNRKILKKFNRSFRMQKASCTSRSSPITSSGPLPTQA